MIERSAWRFAPNAAVFVIVGGPAATRLGSPQRPAWKSAMCAGWRTITCSSVPSKYAPAAASSGSVGVVSFEAAVQM